MESKYKNLLNEYKENCKLHEEQTLKRNYTKSDFYIKKNIKIIKKIKEKGILEEFLSELLIEENIYIKCSAAIESIRNQLFIDKCRKILENIGALNDEQYRNVSINAKWFLSSLELDAENN